MLIGVDIAGKILTGRKHILNYGLVAIETSLGWTLMDKIPTDVKNKDCTMIAISLLSITETIARHRQLDVLRIKDPFEVKSKKELAVHKEFLEIITRDDTGRYEVQTPWHEGHAPLPNNYELARKRLEGVI